LWLASPRGVEITTPSRGVRIGGYNFIRKNANNAKIDLQIYVNVYLLINTLFPNKKLFTSTILSS
jgi:hypothetical protein